MKYVTINQQDQTVRGYNSLKEASRDSVRINQDDPDRPSFVLYEWEEGKIKLSYRGSLMRNFGESELYWGIN